MTELAPVDRGLALIADSDSEFLEKLNSEKGAYAVPPKTILSFEDAQAIIADRGIRLAGIFVNRSFAEDRGINLIQACHLHRPALPIYLLQDQNAVAPEPDFLSELGVQDALRKPLSYSDLAKLVAPALKGFDQEAAIALARARNDVLDTEVTGDNQEFRGINAADFLSGSRSCFDTYIRLASGRFLKVLQAGDAVPPERILSYIRKGVTRLFVRVEAQEMYLNYCEKLATALAGNARVPVEFRASQTLNHGDQIINFLSNVGMRDSTLTHARIFLANTEKVIADLKLRDDKEVGTFLSSLTHYNHAAGTAMLASLLLKPLGFSNQKAIETVGVAALLHDVGLYRTLPDLQDEHSVPKGQEGLFQLHPQAGATLLGRFGKLDPTVIQAVLQHHERRDRKGFPQRLGAGRIHRVAEIIGICDEFVGLVFLAQKSKGVVPMLQMELKVFDGFSAQVVEAFRTALMRPEPEP